MNTILVYPALMGPHMLARTLQWSTANSHHICLRLLQIKFKSKGHWTCGQSIPWVPLPSHPAHPAPNLNFCFSLCFSGPTACERCEMVHEDSWWHIVSVLIILFFIRRYDLCNMWQIWDDTWQTSWWHIISALIIELCLHYMVLWYIEYITILYNNPVVVGVSWEAISAHSRSAPNCTYWVENRVESEW